jgi:hypothetical protein
VCWQLLDAADARRGALTASAATFTHHELRNRNVAATVCAAPDPTHSCPSTAAQLLLAELGRASKVLRKGTINRRLLNVISALCFTYRSGLMYLKLQDHTSKANGGRTFVSSQTLPQDMGVTRHQIRMLTGMLKLSTMLSVLLV